MNEEMNNEEMVDVEFTETKPKRKFIEILKANKKKIIIGGIAIAAIAVVRQIFKKDNEDENDYDMIEGCTCGENCTCGGDYLIDVTATDITEVTEVK